MASEIQKQHRTRNIVLRAIFTLLLAATVFFIFSNSFKIGAVSGAASQKATLWLNAILQRLSVGFTFSETLVRKLGHFAEFALLGFWMMLTLRVYTKRIFAFISWPLLAGLGIAVADEFLQIFVPGRESRVSDVLIDFSGFLAGLLCGLFVLLLVSAFVRHLQGKE